MQIKLIFHGKCTNELNLKCKIKSKKYTQDFKISYSFHKKIAPFWNYVDYFGTKEDGSSHTI